MVKCVRLPKSEAVLILKKINQSIHKVVIGMKKILTIFIICIFFTLCGCSSTDKIESTVEEFVLCIEEDRYDDAVNLMHSECQITADEISSYFALLEKESKTDFSDNFQLIEYEIEDFEDSEAQVKGTYTKASGLVECEDETFTFEIKLVENDTDFGIYKIKFRKK